MISRSLLLLLGIGAFQSIARWLELLALSVYVFDRTASPFIVTLVTLVKFAPLVLFGPVMGMLAMRYARRSMYLVGLIMMILLMLLASVAASIGDLSVAAVLTISFLGGVFWVLDFPVRRTLLGDAVNIQMLGRAMSLDTIANNGTRMLGPLFGGVLLQYAGLSGAFLCSLCIYMLCFCMTWPLSLGRGNKITDKTGYWYARLTHGLRRVSNSRVLSATMLITIVYNLFGFPMLSLLPVLGRERFGLSESAVGTMVAMEGVGALVGGVLLVIVSPHKQYRRIYVLGLFVSLLLAFFYSTSSHLPLVAVLLVAVGAGSAAFASMQTTLVVLNSEPALQSSAFGVLSMSIGAGLIGFFMLGAVASVLGTQAALLLSASAGLLGLLAVCINWPEILQCQPAEDTSPG